MAAVDPEKERLRLARLCGGMADGELEELLEEAETLSQPAREALQSELHRRGSDSAIPSIVAAIPDEAEPIVPVTLRRFRDLPNALVAKSILDSAGVECFLIDENTIRLDWFWSNLLGGIKLWVRPKDADAGELLDQEHLAVFDVEGVGEYKQPRCPNCESLEISYQPLMKRLAYASLLFVGVPMPVTHVAWKCGSCGHAWKEEENGSPEPGP
jgi:hypothetical protein